MGRDDPGSDSSLGDGVGFRIGYLLTQPNAVAAYDPTPPMRNAGGACAIVGDLGRGKTFSMLAAERPEGGSEEGKRPR